MFTIITAITLAVGIGANSAIFSVINGVLLKPLPFEHSENLIAIRHSAPGVGLTDAESAPFLYFISHTETRVSLTDAPILGDVGEGKSVAAFSRGQESARWPRPLQFRSRDAPPKRIDQPPPAANRRGRHNLASGARSHRRAAIASYPGSLISSDKCLSYNAASP